MVTLIEGIIKAKYRSDYITELNSVREKYREKEKLITTQSSYLHRMLYGSVS